MNHLNELLSHASSIRKTIDASEPHSLAEPHPDAVDHPDESAVELLSREQGKIDLCPFQQCGHTCCDFSRDNYILMYPGELAGAIAEGRGLRHLEIMDDGYGGHRAICRASNTASCDEGYKPLDCASYPFFPSVDDGDDVVVIDKGAKCPLLALAIGDHRKWVTEQWLRVIMKYPRIRGWLRSARLIGYERLREGSSEPSDVVAH